MNIVLTGFRGSGKSSVGKMLAEQLNLDYIDTDEEIELRAGKTTARIFNEDGEAAFRELEKEEVLRACRRSNIVIAVGGGAVTNPELAAEIKQTALVVLLQASPEILYERIEKDKISSWRRPALTEKKGLEEVKELLARRQNAYIDCAHIIIDTSGMEIKEVVNRAMSEFQGPEFIDKFSQIIT